MFSGSFRFLESEQTKITLHDIESDIMKQILSFIYTAEIQVHKKKYCSSTHSNLYKPYLLQLLLDQ